MKITRNDGLAEESLKFLRPMLRAENRFYAHITPYENGREIGHVLHLGGYLLNGVYLDAAFTYAETTS